MARRETFRKALPLVVVVLFVAVIAFSLLNVGRWLSHPDPIRRVEIIVVSAGDVEHRLPLALDLLKRGEAKKVWVVPSESGPVLHEPGAIIDYAKARGVKDEVVVLRKRSRSLLRDARVIAARVRRRRITRVAVIASPVELARTRLTFDRVSGLDVLAWSDSTRYNAARWWRDGFGTLLEAGRYLATLSVVGPGAELRTGRVPVSLPLRAVGGGFGVALIVGAICRPLARRIGLIDVPRVRRVHTRATPKLGGLAIVAGIVGGVMIAGGVQLGALGLAAAVSMAVVSIVGLTDDITGLGAPARLLWAAGAGAIAWLLGLRAEVFPNGTTAGSLFDPIFTVLWFVGITFALNFLDNLDGLTAGVGAASAVTIAVAAALGGQFVVAVAASALAGACLGYLFHNVHPARLFMGDMGALPIGFGLAALSLGLRPKVHAPLSMAVPVIALAVPIFDTTLIVVSRVRAGQSPAIGGTDHTSHRLLARGLSPRRAAAFLWIVQLVLGAIAVVISRSSPAVGWPLTALVVAGGLISLRVFLSLPPWKPSWQMEASERLVQHVHQATVALNQLEQVVSEEGLRLSDPRTGRSVQETLRRLERVRRLLQEAAGDEDPAS
jgi:UDP-GlcNAc:undecaprenyl-phosphate GlcNAc-1-phosphate transferase